jgi:ABC-type branched-subunit amino acid transport system substrate-binding protein
VQLALRDLKFLKKSFANLKATFVGEASRYQGVTGSTALDPAGDRMNGDFDFWAVRPHNGNYTWVRIGTYSNGVLTLF